MQLLLRSEKENGRFLLRSGRFIEKHLIELC